MISKKKLIGIGSLVAMAVSGSVALTNPTVEVTATITFKPNLALYVALYALIACIVAWCITQLVMLIRHASRS